VNVSFRVDPASRSPFDPSTAVNATFSVSIRNTDGSTSGTGRNTGASGTRAYVVNWLDPSGQPGIDCPLGVNNTCELDASQRERVFLTMDTNPTATDASVDYATNGSNAGVVNASAGLTNASGQDTVALFARGEGAIDVFATSGSDGDGATVSITNVPACSPVTRQQFDNGTLPANWDAVAVRNAFDGGVSDATSDSGEYSVFVSGDEGYVRSSTLNTSDCGSVAVEFWLRKGANSFSEPPDGNDVLEVQYRRSNGNWRRFARFDPDDYANGEIIEVSETITAGNAMHDGFQLRWHLTDADAAGFDFWHVDDVFVDGDP
jgi:hypothetical protein